MQHFPVLLEAVLRYLDPRPGETYLDLTAGYGGHAEAILERTLRKPHFTLVDRDQNAIAHLRREFADKQGEIIHGDFYQASRGLLAMDVRYDLILADLGVSSPHLDNASRGFSLKLDGPLDMRMDERQSLTASEIVNNYPEAELARIIREYGEEPRANKIARYLVANRPIAGTNQLASLVAQTVNKRKPGQNKIHPATRTFQALRIAVNDELELLKRSLPQWIDLLAPGGRIVIISFHSLEDRLVKQALAEASGSRYDAVTTLLTNRPVTPDANELVFNPRARSAKLRAAKKK